MNPETKVIEVWNDVPDFNEAFQSATAQAQKYENKSGFTLRFVHVERDMKSPDGWTFSFEVRYV